MALLLSRQNIESRDWLTSHHTICELTKNGVYFTMIRVYSQAKHLISIKVTEITYYADGNSHIPKNHQIITE